jgi:outer membrane protein OmpA-like peptidoglycan-associated protein
MASEAGFPAGAPQLDVRPFLSFDAPIVEKRARDALDAPGTVQFTYSAGLLTASGQAPADWIARLQARGPTLPGVDRLDASGLSASSDALRIAVEQANSLHVSFEIAETRVDPGQAAVLDDLAERIRAITEYAIQSGDRLRITIVGRADKVGPSATNERLSQTRARELQQALIERGLPAGAYPVRGELVEAGRDRTAGVEIRIGEAAP